MQSSNDWVAAFPLLNKLDAPTRSRLLAAALPVTLPEGVMVFREGAECSNYLLVLQGSVRVQKLSESGHEIVLYRVESGQSCVLTTSCLLACETYNAEAVSESPVEAIAIPKGSAGPETALRRPADCRDLLVFAGVSANRTRSISPDPASRPLRVNHTLWKRMVRPSFANESPRMSTRSARDSPSRRASNAGLANPAGSPV